MKKPIKKALTLIEVMIVILIIGIIGSVVGYNMKGSLDKAKVFKTEQGAKKLYELALLALEEQGVSLAASGTNSDAIKTSIQTALNGLGVAGNITALMQDGWGEPFIDFAVTATGGLEFKSKKYEEYCKAKEKTHKYPWQ